MKGGSMFKMNELLKQIRPGYIEANEFRDLYIERQDKIQKVRGINYINAPVQNSLIRTEVQAYVKPIVQQVIFAKERNESSEIEYEPEEIVPQFAFV